MGNQFTTFTNCRVCVNGELLDGERLVVSQDDGLILKSTGYIGGDIIDLDDAIIAPGLLELHADVFGDQSSSVLEAPSRLRTRLESVARQYPSHGVTSFWATVPTIEEDKYEKVLPGLAPVEFDSGASLMGAHVEGPYLHQKHPGTHNPALFVPYSTSKLVYGQSATTNEIIKLATVAPDVGNGSGLIKGLSGRGIRVSVGHTHATFDMGLAALSSGASCLTSLLTCMSPLDPRDPGPVGLISLPHNHQPPPPYYTILCDGVSLHPQVVSLLFRANTTKAILASNDTGFGDLRARRTGTFQEQQQQATSAPNSTIDQGVRNLMKWSGCTIAEAVRTATENIADFMGVSDRGKLEEGRRADFIVLNDEGYLQETWIAGVKAWSNE